MTTPRDWVKWLSYLWAFGLGITLVLALFPAELLLHGALPDALLSGDVAQHTVGQRAFLEDRWHWPLLKTTLLNAPGGLNIAMTDSIPLVALPLKLFHAWLPRGFSAVQFWEALDYLLQPVAAVFALRSAGETRLAPAVAVAVFAIATPAFLFRHPHSALSSHFLLMAALAGYFRMTRDLRGQRLLPMLLPPVGLLVHPYLAFMIFAVLAGAPLTLALRGERRWLGAAISVGAGLALMVLTALLFGYQAATPSGGFGETSMNLLSPFYPGYSWFLGAGAPFLDATGTQYEGYQYLGAGLLLLLGICTVAACLSTRTLFLRRHYGLALACAGLTAMAISNVVYVGYDKLIVLPPPPEAVQQLRASGRLFWPVAYVLLVGAVVTLGRLLPARAAAAVLFVLALLQLGDTSLLRYFVHRDFRARMAQPIDPVRLDRLLDASDRMTILPTFGCGADAAVPDFMQLLLASSRHDIPANTMYVARFKRLQNCADTAAATAPLRPGELRVFMPIEAVAGPPEVPDGARYCRRLSNVAVCTLRTDLLAGLAPPAPPAIPFGRKIATTVKGQTDILGSGWYTPEPPGTWTVDHVAEIAVAAAFPPADVSLTAWAGGFTGSGGAPQRVAVSVNGRQVAVWEVPEGDPVAMRATIPRADLVPGVQVLRLAIAKPTRPLTAGNNSDARQLGVFLAALRFDPVGQAGGSGSSASR